MIDEVPTTWAPYPEGSECPWCCLEHVCPSNIVWLQPKEGDEYHLFPKAWRGDIQLVPSAAVRSDGMYIHLHRREALCGVRAHSRTDYIDRTDMNNSTILGKKNLCCPSCWEKRW